MKRISAVALAEAVRVFDRERLYAYYDLIASGIRPIDVSMLIVAVHERDIECLKYLPVGRMEGTIETWVDLMYLAPFLKDHYDKTGGREPKV